MSTLAYCHPAPRRTPRPSARRPARCRTRRPRAGRKRGYRRASSWRRAGDQGDLPVQLPHHRVLPRGAPSVTGEHRAVPPHCVLRAVAPTQPAQSWQRAQARQPTQRRQAAHSTHPTHWCRDRATPPAGRRRPPRCPRKAMDPGRDRRAQGSGDRSGTAPLPVAMDPATAALPVVARDPATATEVFITRPRPDERVGGEKLHDSDHVQPRRRVGGASS